ncbi:hypothetical protein [Erwinia sp. MYb416]|uniref:hypothetical protein n=1 Tax=Erwinia sp. MYb416 TaxID=3108532 RepID=UPI0030B40153
MDADIISYESMVSTQEAAKWAFWAMIGTWFSGFATFIAVLGTLFLANRKPKAFVTCKVGRRIIFGSNALLQKIQENGIAIEVTNQSSVPAQIVSIGWKVGKKIYFHQIFGDANSATLPKKIEYGEKALFWIKLDDKEQWLEGIAEKIINQGGSIKNLRCLVNISTGKSFSVKPEKEFISELLAASVPK